jgi:hypothetical protein
MKLDSFIRTNPGLFLFSSRPHIVFRYGIKLNGKLLQLNITTLRLTGCEVKLLGHNLFSYCGLLGVENTATRHDASLIDFAKTMFSHIIG